jgi:anti-sigma B factor antagonist
VSSANARGSRFDARRTGDGRYELRGELDITTAEILDAILEREPAGELTFDATGLDFLDSSGMRVLLKAVVHGRKITVRSPSRTVARTLRMSGVDRLPGLEVVE